MSLTGLTLRNFKSFADSGEITLAPLTVIFGKNNSGKSSILQSLLILRQTTDNPDYGSRLNLRGPLYKAGSYADLVHQHRSAKHVVFGLQVDGAASTLTGVRGRQIRGSIELEFASDEPNPPRLSRLLVRPEATLRDVRRLEIHRGQGAGGPYKMAIGGVNLGGERNADFRFSPTSFFPIVGFREVTRVGRPNELQDRSRVSARQLIRVVTETLSSIRAVGAFRSEPERNYEFLGTGRSTPASLGADVVNALIEDSTRRRGRGQLFRSVNHWLKAVGHVRLLPIKNISKKARLFELRLRDTDSGRWANYADVGFGIGQALPVFVEGLRTQKGGLFLVQEPEIHLHPDAQLGMADFLVALVQGGRRVLVETHSEQILLRIRHAILAKGKNGKPLLPTDVSILHVGKTKNGTSHVNQLKIDEFGQVENWPPGFLEEATSERLAILERQAAATEE